VKPAYLSQEVAELDPALRVLEAVEQVAKVVDLGGGKTIGASSLADRFGFTGNAQWTRVGDLSGGERRRLQILRLLMGEPNVILLDEPTNDLDIDTLNALEDLLDGWPGTLIVVSHDRYFLERVTTVTASLMGDGSVAALPGGVEEYLRKRKRAAPVDSVSTQAAKKSGSGATAARRARSSARSSARSAGSTSARPSCTPSSPRRRPTSPPSPRSTRSCGRCRPTRPSSRTAGSSSASRPRADHRFGRGDVRRSADVLARRHASDGAPALAGAAPPASRRRAARAPGVVVGVDVTSSSSS
jgi:hypothetical protein